VGTELSSTAKRKALAETVELLTQGVGQPDRSQIPDILSALNRAMSDARHIPKQHVTAPKEKRL
jgi:hypothetical protein